MEEDKQANLKDRHSNKRKKAAEDVGRAFSVAMQFRRATENLDESSEDEVFEEVSADQYEERVRERRKKDQFIEDDLGDGDYYDDGEEMYTTEQNKKRKSKEDKAREFKRARLEDASKGIAKLGSFFGKGLALSENIPLKPDCKALANDDLENLLSSLSAPESRETKPSAVSRQFSPAAVPSRHVVSLKSSSSRALNRELEATMGSTDDPGEITDSAGLMNDGNDDGVPFTGDTATRDVVVKSEFPVSTKIEKEVPKGTTSESQEPEHLATILARARAAGIKRETFPDSIDDVKREAMNPNPSEEPTTKQIDIKSAFLLKSMNIVSTKLETEIAAAFSTSVGDPIAPSEAYVKHVPLIKNENEEPFFLMYWYDLYEPPRNPGTLFLFGKVKQSEERLVSCCVKLCNMRRTLYVLPRSSEVPFGVIEKELRHKLSTFLDPAADTQIDEVMRDYAFELPDIPREVSRYIRVRYNAARGAVKMNEGRTFSHVFGCETSIIEQFILETGIKGPCWLKITHSHDSGPLFSYCKTEAVIEDIYSAPAPSDPAALRALCYIQTVMEPIPSPPMNVLALTVQFFLDRVITEVGIINFRIFASVPTSTTGAYAPSSDWHTLYRSFPGKKLSRDFEEQIDSQEQNKPHRQMHSCRDEREMLNKFLAMMVQNDPDIIVSHNIHGVVLDPLFTRMNHYKIKNWAMLGRVKRDRWPFERNQTFLKCPIVGRIVVDTFQCARELIREVSYSLEFLSETKLKIPFQDIDLTKVSQYYDSKDNLLALLNNRSMASDLTYRLMLHLDLLPLTLEITNISGNLWSSTLMGNRSNRIEYLLLHEFYRQKFILPDKEIAKKDGHTGRKPKYSGGLVFEPKKGLYSNYTVVLDFNSLYPSIIQEFNICFTTVQRQPTATKPSRSGAVAASESAWTSGAAVKGGEEAGGLEEEEEVMNGAMDEVIPPDPPHIDSDKQMAILPSVIRYLVKRRREVKQLMEKEKNGDAAKYNQYNIKQLALKILANSIASRFYAKPLATLVTAKGRIILENTKRLAESLELNVIYGDTDSIMIYTGRDNLKEAREIGIKVKQQVNKLYRCLEIDIDYIFKKILLLTKKKYAALKVSGVVDGKEVLTKEMKGIDLVRRDWCPLSKKTGEAVVDRLLSDDPGEEVLNSIRDILTEVSHSMREGKVDLKEFVITKGLQKNPKDYPDERGQPHVKVAKEMLRSGKQIGDLIPYVICAGEGETAELDFVQRSHHPSDLEESKEKLKIDIEWYLSHQLLPPLARLCDPIDGVSQLVLAEFLGLDPQKYEEHTAIQIDRLERFTKTDEEYFPQCRPLLVPCVCGAKMIFRKIVDLETTQQVKRNGIVCETCNQLIYWAVVFNSIQLYINEMRQKLYDSFLVCENNCGYKTRGKGNHRCATENCGGKLRPEFTPEELHIHNAFLKSLFDLDSLSPVQKGKFISSNEIVKSGDKADFEAIREVLEFNLEKDSLNWVDLGRIFN